MIKIGNPGESIYLEPLLLLSCYIDHLCDTWQVTIPKGFCVIDGPLLVIPHTLLSDVPLPIIFPFSLSHSPFP